MKKHGVTIDCLKDLIHFKMNHCHHSSLGRDTDRVKETFNDSNKEGEVKLSVKQILQRKSKDSAATRPVIESKSTAVNLKPKPVTAPKLSVDNLEHHHASKRSNSEAIDIELIGAAAFLTNTSKKQSDQVFAASMKEIDELRN